MMLFLQSISVNNKYSPPSIFEHPRYTSLEPFAHFPLMYITPLAIHLSLSLTKKIFELPGLKLESFGIR